MFTSCAFLQKIDVQHQVVAIKMATRTGTMIGLEQLVRNEETRVQIAGLVKQDIARNVLRLLSGDNVQISTENLNLLLAKVPVPLRPFMYDALTILDIYMKRAKTEAQLDDNAVQLLKAFFEGIVEGCDLVIARTGGTNDGVGNRGISRPEEHSEGREATVR
jgi:hypothetical protein